MRNSVVTAVEAPDVGRCLAAWVVPADEALTAAELRAVLKQALPGPFVPAEIELVPGLPLTSSGKVDRAALGGGQEVFPGARQVSGGASNLLPLVARVWSAVPGVVDVAPSDDFFELGGQSLQTVQVANRLGVELGRDVPVALLYQHPTLSALANALEGELRKPADAGAHQQPTSAP